MTVSRCTTKIGRRSDGLHALIVGDSTVWPAATSGVFWKGTEPAVISPIPALPDFMSRSEAYVEWLGLNTLLVCDETQTSMRVSELAYPALTLTNQWTFGDASSRWGNSCRTSDGGVAFCVYAEANPNNELWLDLAYRAPDLGIPGQQTTWYQRFKLPPSLVPQLNAPIPQNVGFCQGPDGLLYAFCTRDSSGHICMTRFQKGPGATWVLKDHHPYYIVDVNGEYPTVTAMPDKYNNRVIIGYQSYGWIFQCPKNNLVSKVALMAIYPDAHTEKLSEGDWWSSHIALFRYIPWPRRDGIYMITEKINEADCGSQLLPAYFRYAKPDKIYADTVIAGAYKLEAFSDDGWMAIRSYDAVTGDSVDLVKMRFSPELTAKNSGTNVVVSWDESQANDQLYTSLNQKDFTAGQIGVSPATVTKDVESKWFKVKQSELPLSSDVIVENLKRIIFPSDYL